MLHLQQVLIRLQDVVLPGKRSTLRVGARVSPSRGSGFFIEGPSEWSASELVSTPQQVNLVFTPSSREPILSKTATLLIELRFA